MEFFKIFWNPNTNYAYTKKLFMIYQLKDAQDVSS